MLGEMLLCLLPFVHAWGGAAMFAPMSSCFETCRHFCKYVFMLREMPHFLQICVHAWGDAAMLAEMFS